MHNDFLIHFGITGMQWGVRRYQNPDGTLTEEGRRRYLKNPDEQYGVQTYTREAVNVFDKATDEFNKNIGKINKEWDKKRPQGFAGDSIDDLKANIEYTKQVRDMWTDAYCNVLAKDMGTDPSSIKGQAWLKDVLYYDNFDKEVSRLEKDLEKKERNEGRFKDTGDGKAQISISGYDKATQQKIKDNYSPREMKETVQSIVDYFSQNGTDILKEMTDKNTGKNLSDKPIDEQFYILMKLFDDTVFDDLK